MVLLKMDEFYAYKFKAQEYPRYTIRDLNKLPLDSYEQLQSAIARFNDVKTPDGKDLSSEQKNHAWINIKRASKLLEYDLEVEDWIELELHRKLKNAKMEPTSFVIPATRAFIDPKSNDKYIEGIASSDQYDTYMTKMSREALDNMALQINNSSESPFLQVILENTHREEWFDNLGVIDWAYTIEENGIYKLVVRSKLDNDNPLSQYLFKILTRQKIEKDNDLFDEFPTPFIGMSVNGFVTDYELDQDFEDNHFSNKMEEFPLEDFKSYEGVVPLTIKEFFLKRIAITSKSSNHETFVQSVMREVHEKVLTKRSENSNINIEYFQSGKEGEIEMSEKEKENVAVIETPTTNDASEPTDAEDKKIERTEENIEKTEVVVEKTIETPEETDNELKRNLDLLKEQMESVKNEVQEVKREQEEKEEIQLPDMTQYVKFEDYENLKTELKRSQEELDKVLLTLTSGLTQVFNLLKEQPTKRSMQIEEKPEIPKKVKKEDDNLSSVQKLTNLMNK